MKTSNALNADPRTVVGKKVETLRRAGITPANIYGGGALSTAVQIESKGLLRRLIALGRESAAVVTVGDSAHRVIVKGWDVHPVSGDVIHVDFQRAAQA